MVSRELLAAILPTARVGALLAMVGLVTSRFVLVVHEFLGHAGVAVLLGGELVNHRLFLFGGGWVLTRTPATSTFGSLLVSLGGLVLELGFAALMITLSRRYLTTLVSRTAASLAGGLCIVHVGVYLSMGTHYGYGDGLLLHRLLGTWRAALVAALAIFSIAAAFWVGRELRRHLHGVFATDRGISFAAHLLIAAALAGGIHGGLMLAERSVTSDPTYAEVMREEAVRQARAIADSEARRRVSAGVPMTDAEQRARVRTLADERRPLPVRPFFYGLLAIGWLIGVTGPQRRRATSGMLAFGDLRGLAIATATSIAIVGLLSAPWWRNV